MKKKHLLLLSIITGLLLWLAWPVRGFSFLLLVAFVPLLYAEDYIYRNKERYSKSLLFLMAYLSFFIWNALTTWWVYNSSAFGVVMAVVFNSLFMALAFWLFHITRRNIYEGRFSKGHYGYLALFAYWIGYEYFHLDWDLTWSWLNLGNGFSEYYKFIQWYAYTGTLGGTLWILLSNVILLDLVKKVTTRTYASRALVFRMSLTLLLVLWPAIFSLYIYYNYTEQENPVEIVIVQPNIDPYNEKFGGMSTELQAMKILDLIQRKITPETDFVIAPETALPEGVWLDELNMSPSIKKFRELLRRYPNTSVVIGATTYKMYEPGNATATARQYPGMERRYDVYNTALLIDTGMHIQTYHKSKLVPGVEKMPYPQIFGFLEEYAIDLGGMVGSHGTQAKRSVLTSLKGNSIAPVICYESIYGAFVTGYIRNGAHLIAIITNDGWWGDTPGYKQHNSYARLRAIETRRSIARSANTGISSFFNQRGDMLQSTNWWQEDVLSYSLNTNTHLTFYVRAGDYIGRIMSFTALLLLLYTIVSIILKRKSYKKL